jgi:hypothetical protein
MGAKVDGTFSSLLFKGFVFPISWRLDFAIAAESDRVEKNL